MSGCASNRSPLVPRDAVGRVNVDAYADWLKISSVPKLFLKAEPGGILAGGKVLEHARSLPLQTEVTIKGVHFVQEDSPDDIGEAVGGWMKTLS